MATPHDEAIQSIVPAELKQLRACLFCSLVKTWQQFEISGCDNCPFLDLEDNRENIAECTSASFDGMIAMMKPEESWVARWQRIAGGKCKPGVYAISVSGKLPHSVINNLQKQNIRYIPRDTTDRHL